MAAFLYILLAYLLSSSAAQKNTEDATTTTAKQESMNAFTSFFNNVMKGAQMEMRDMMQLFEVAYAYLGFSQCSNVKNLIGMTYEKMNNTGSKPDVDQLTLDFLTNNYSSKYNMSVAAQLIPTDRHFNPQQKLYIYVHGFTDNPTKSSFTTIRDALFSTGTSNVLALDGSSLIRSQYLRSSVYVRFMGEKLGEVLAALVKNGVDPDQIHVIGHSLGAHISGFTGKQFTKLTGMRLGRITGLDPAGPCFSNVDDDYRLNSTDAKFVDVIHTDGGYIGMSDPVGHVDYYPNDGSQQPECLFPVCSHFRACDLFAESCINGNAFPAVRCDSWKAFSKGDCDSDISYMGLPSKPGTTGRYYLQTKGQSPFSLGMNGTRYMNDKGVVRTITGLFS